MEPLAPPRLRYFVEIARLGSFSRAATALGIAQPALSRHVRAMERELGVQLLHRNGRGVLLTDAGRQLLDRGAPLIEQLQRLQADVAALAGEPAGKVVLGIPPTICLVLATPLITDFRRRFPKVTLEIIEGLSGHIHEWLSNGRLDVGVIYDAPRTRHLQADRLLEEDLFLVCPAGKPIGQGDAVPIRALAGLPLIMPRQPHGLRMLVEAAARRRGVPITIAYEMDALPVIKDLVVRGDAYTVLPSNPVYDEVAAGRLVLRRIEDPPLTRTLILATSTRQPLSQAARLLVTQLRQLVFELVESGKWSAVIKT
ncbi:MAG: LysR family transcriptional regulator [Gammaproteobacteria bacterium]|nr:MAG: LysR family transcriptional regulator [Gammaproteobacteria bacterium]